MTEKLKLCINCLNCRRDQAKPTEFSTCQHESAMSTNPVDGSTETLFCSTQRTLVGGTFCGPTGQFFEERK